MSQSQTTLSREEVRQILARHPGSRAEVCQAANVTRQTLHIWLDGRMTSANIEQAATAKALELLAKEAETSER